MSLGGWMVMFLSVGSVTLLLVWCIWKLLTTPEDKDHLHGLDITPPDTKDNEPPST